MIPYRLQQRFRPLVFRLAMFAANPRKPSQRIVHWLIFGWNNEGFSADPDYLVRVWQEALKARSILECGSGISTVILGLVAKETGVEVCSLEDHEEWCNRVNKALRQLGLPNRATLSPRRSYGDFDWYEAPKGVFDLVICDGPGPNCGGRYGLMPAMSEQITGTILLDDAERSDEQAIIQRWQREFGVDATIVHESRGAYSIIRAKAVSQRR